MVYIQAFQIKKNVRKNNFRMGNIVYTEYNYSESGFIAIFFALSISVLLSLLAMIVDGSQIFSSKLEQEANAELAAIVALRTFIQSRDGTPSKPFIESFQAAVREAETVAGQNYYAASNRTSPEVIPDSLVSFSGGSSAPGSSGNVVFGRFTRDVSTNAITLSFPVDPSLPAVYSSLNLVQLTLKTRDDAKLKLNFLKALKIYSTKTVSHAYAYYDDVSASNFKTPYFIVR
jgi:Flp pilus assembly protein TadG